MGALCDALMEDDSTFIAGLVRLSFHDCVGGCDGCINKDNPENAGKWVYSVRYIGKYDMIGVYFLLYISPVMVVGQSFLSLP